MAINLPPSCPRVRSSHGRLVWFGLAMVAGLALPASGRAEDASMRARLTYTKVLEGSTPEYLMITVDSEGEGSYEGRRLADPPNARPLKLSPSTTKRLFELCDQLNHFESIALESGKKVANLGRKVLTYERGGQENRVEFNYTRRKEAQELVGLLEKISGVQEHLETLEYAIKYDRLSLPGELRRIQIDLERKALADPEMLVPVLEKIVRDRRFLNLAQSRAQNILDQIQASN